MLVGSARRGSEAAVVPRGAAANDLVATASYDHFFFLLLGRCHFWAPVLVVPTSSLADGHSGPCGCSLRGMEWKIATVTAALARLPYSFISRIHHY